MTKPQGKINFNGAIKEYVLLHSFERALLLTAKLLNFQS